MTGGYDPDRLRSRLRSIRLGRVFRVIHRDRRSAPLGAVPTPSRFEALVDTNGLVYAYDVLNPFLESEPCPPPRGASFR